MGSRFTELSVDSAEPEKLAQFWADVLGTEVEEIDDESASLKSPPGGGPQMVFAKVPEAKTVKNRLHIDLSPVGCEQGEEVARVLSLGARKVDIGQGDVSWVVLADPEGNEFCILRGRVD